LSEFYSKIKYHSIYYWEYWKSSIEKFSLARLIEECYTKGKKKSEYERRNRAKNNIFFTCLIGRISDDFIDDIDRENKTHYGSLKKP
jgi:hypothetical protein